MSDYDDFLYLIPTKIVKRNNSSTLSQIQFHGILQLTTRQSVSLQKSQVCRDTHGTF